MDKRVNIFLKREKNWQDEMTLLRDIILECKVTEDYKWMHPCYTYNDKNIVLIHGFNQYCALLFHKGALLKDPKNILIQQTKNTQSARQIRFKNIQEIEKLRSTIKQYIKEAIKNEEQGKSVELKKTKDYDVPKELKEKFKVDPAYENAFKALTPGRQRGYLLHFGSAKQSETRSSRIEGARAKIFDGKGHNER